jgi:CDGSH-type Zn-finger protein
MLEPGSTERTPCGTEPVLVHLDPGIRYAFCTCGLSATQPFCDGTHRGTGLQPIKFFCEAAEDVWMCMCKQSRDGYRCDGSHSRLKNGRD